MLRVESTAMPTRGNFVFPAMHPTLARTALAWWQHLRFRHKGGCEGEREGEGEHECESG